MRVFQQRNSFFRVDYAVEDLIEIVEDTLCLTETNATFYDYLSIAIRPTHSSFPGKLWRNRPDSNRRKLDRQSSALAAMLRLRENGCGRWI